MQSGLGLRTRPAVSRCAQRIWQQVPVWMQVVGFGARAATCADRPLEPAIAKAVRYALTLQLAIWVNHLLNLIIRRRQ